MIPIDDIKTDETTLRDYVVKVPKGWKKAKLEDFYVAHKCFERRHCKLIGLNYLEYSEMQEKYFLRVVTEFTLDKDVLPYIHLIWIFPDEVNALKEKILKGPKDFEVYEWYEK